MRKVADVLASFHHLPAGGLEPLTPEDLTRRVREAVNDLAAACPTLRPRVAILSRELEARLNGLEAVEPVTLHNDFHWNQIGIKRDRCAVLDLERMCLGDPMVDVANFAAQLRMLACRPDLSVSLDEAERWARLFLEHWTRQNGRTIDGGRFAVYAVLSLLELARGALRHLRQDWTALCRQCVQRAEQELSRAEQEASI